MELSAAAYVACWVALVTPTLMQLDIAEHRLPNAIVMPGWAVAATGLGLAWMLTGTFPVTALVTGVVTLVLAFLLALGGGLGMGDVKLLFPLGIGLGLQTSHAILVASLVAIMLGGVVAVITLIRHRRRKTDIPFGPFLLLGYWAGYLA
ncbi:MAG: prepilin peptidase [Gulosibacter sp.]|uniref:prepilin peptidase n=1 Tax=Gulosibacter sp. TaxID=2817531 RepID=UPI003F92CFD1